MLKCNTGLSIGIWKQLQYCSYVLCSLLISISHSTDFSSHCHTLLIWQLTLTWWYLAIYSPSFWSPGNTSKFNFPLRNTIEFTTIRQISCLVHCSKGQVWKCKPGKVLGHDFFYTKLLCLLCLPDTTAFWYGVLHRMNSYVGLGTFGLSLFLLAQCPLPPALTGDRAAWAPGSSPWP